MISKGIWVGLVAIAFVAGTLATGTMAYGASTQGKPFGEILDFLNDLSDSFKLHDEDVLRHTTADQLVQFRDGIDGLTERVTTLENNLPDLQEKIDDKKAEIEQLETAILPIENSINSLIQVLVAIDPIEVLDCELQCVEERAMLRADVDNCLAGVPAGEDPEVVCKEQIDEFRNHQCTCDEESEQIRQEISDLEFQLGPLKEQMLICKAELQVLKDLQIEFQSSPPLPTDNP